MATVVRLQVSGIDFGDDDRIDSIEQRVPEVSFVCSDGVVIAEVFLDVAPASQFNQVADIIHRLKSHDGLLIEQVEPSLVNVSDIARLVGLSRQAVAKWTANPNYAFPRAEGSVGGEDRPQKIWSLYSVNKWLSEELKLDLGLDLPSPQLVRKIDAYLVRMQEPSPSEWALLSVEGFSSTSVVEGRQKRGQVRVSPVATNKSETHFVSMDIKTAKDMVAL